MTTTESRARDMAMSVETTASEFGTSHEPSNGQGLRFKRCHPAFNAPLKDDTERKGQCGVAVWRVAGRAEVTESWGWRLRSRLRPWSPSDLDIRLTFFGLVDLIAHGCPTILPKEEAHQKRATGLRRRPSGCCLLSFRVPARLIAEAPELIAGPSWPAPTPQDPTVEGSGAS